MTAKAPRKSLFEIVSDWTDWTDWTCGYSLCLRHEAPLVASASQRPERPEDWPHLKNRLEAYRQDEIVSLRKLQGGALHAHWELGWRQHPATILRWAGPKPMQLGLSVRQEFRLLEALRARHAFVPTPLVCLADRAMALYAKAPGRANQYRFTKEQSSKLAQWLAALHCRPVPAALPALPPLPATGIRERIQGELERNARTAADGTVQWMGRWLLDHREPEEDSGEASGEDSGEVLIHGDVRAHNILTDLNGCPVTLLDFEFARLSSPLEELGWLLAPCWYPPPPLPPPPLAAEEHQTRFHFFLARYEQASGTSLDWQRLRWWQIYALFRFYAIAQAQAARAEERAPTSLDVALTWFRLGQMRFLMLHLARLYETLPAASRLLF